MKKLLVLSGKGGTGKTTLSASLIHLLQATSYADCDVDAPNLHILKTPEGEVDIHPFYGLPKAVIDQDICIGCGLCATKCRFQAITTGAQITVDPFLCEGCGLCQRLCPIEAIHMAQTPSGETTVYRGEVTFSTAILKTGSGASGKLVTQVKKNMVLSDDPDAIAVIDGSPGIGCPVIASISGVDMVLLVTEPTLSGMSDFVRILATVRHFGVPALACINKCDIHPEKTAEIKAFCAQEHIPVVGEIPYDPLVPQAMNMGKPIVALESTAGAEIREILNRVRRLI